MLAHMVISDMDTCPQALSTSKSERLQSTGTLKAGEGEVVKGEVCSLLVLQSRRAAPLQIAHPHTERGRRRIMQRRCT